MNIIPESKNQIKIVSVVETVFKNLQMMNQFCLDQT